MRQILATLKEAYEARETGLQLEQIAGGYRISTRPEMGEAVKEFYRFKNRHKLSRAGLETLAIVAYKPPVTHPEVQEIRGVASESSLRTLLERRMLRIVGRKDTVGKPLLYGTTKDFLEYFGLAGLDDLPPVDEFEHLLQAADGDSVLLPGMTDGESVESPFPLVTTESGEPEAVPEMHAGVTQPVAGLKEPTG